MDKNKLENRISDIQFRIYELNARIDAEVNPSEIRKMEKSIKKLDKEKEKLRNKLGNLL